jgi:N-carbamoylputrescine amidase
MRKVTVAATQMSCTWNRRENIAKAEAMVRRAAAQGAQIILLQELFETPYFCQEEDPVHMNLATSLDDNPAVAHFRTVAQELQVVLPISFFEVEGRARYNTTAVIDADGSLLGIYRKAHIPDGPGYEEKYYFNPGDTGFKVWQTRYAKIGVGICWDQWFPETARALALMGAELIFYPTAIGSEPRFPELDSRDHWQRAMQGHSASNLTPVIASNRIGTEIFGDSSITFYGSSFITDGTGAKICEADRLSEVVLVQEFDLDELELRRSAWGVFRDRRTDHYGVLLSLDGKRAR